MKKIILIAMILLSYLNAGISIKKEKISTYKDYPKWVLKLPTSPDKLYTIGSVKTQGKNNFEDKVNGERIEAAFRLNDKLVKKYTEVEFKEIAYIRALINLSAMKELTIKAQEKTIYKGKNTISYEHLVKYRSDIYNFDAKEESTFLSKDGNYFILLSVEKGNFENIAKKGGKFLHKGYNKYFLDGEYFKIFEDFSQAAKIPNTKLYEETTKEKVYKNKTKKSLNRFWENIHDNQINIFGSAYLQHDNNFHIRYQTALLKARYKLAKSTQSKKKDMMKLTKVDDTTVAKLTVSKVLKMTIPIQVNIKENGNMDLMLWSFSSISKTR